MKWCTLGRYDKPRCVVHFHSSGCLSNLFPKRLPPPENLPSQPLIMKYLQAVQDQAFLFPILAHLVDDNVTFSMTKLKNIRIDPPATIVGFFFGVQACSCSISWSFLQGIVGESPPTFWPLEDVSWW